MPDIREILAALTPEDKVLWSQHRTEMRRSYITAHSTTVTVNDWCAYDDAFLDLIDIKLAILFERAGKLNAQKQIIEDDAHIEQVENDIADTLKGFKAKEQVVTSDGTELMQNTFAKAGNTWPNGQGAAK